MKINKILSTLFIACIITSCSESFLDSENLTGKDSQSFPATPADASQVLTAAYRSILSGSVPETSLIFLSELMSDDRLASGGTDDSKYQAIARYKINGANIYSDIWKQYYEGIYRSNFLLSVLEQISWENEEQRNVIEAEALFLRGYYYFDMARLFGTVPLVTEPTPQNNPKATPEELYGQIAADLKRAIELFPATRYQSISTKRLGHANKWAAEALMARVYLFYTGYYQKDAIPTRENGEVSGTISKQEVIAWVDDCIANSGHDLIPDFRNLWPYSYSQDYEYVKDNLLSWIDETGANVETVFAIKHSTTTWDGRNLLALFYGLRYQDEGAGYDKTFPFGQGWGSGTVNPKIYHDWPSNDIRKKGSILNVNDPTENVEYTFGCSSHIEETGFLQKKYIPINVKKDDGGIISMAEQLYGSNFDFASSNFQDEYVIRFADVLLMGAELGSSKSQEYMDRVRKRVGLVSVPVTLENIKAERRWELAFEGIRYYDLLRWHDEDVLTANRQNIDVYNGGEPGRVSISFRKETGGFLQIPESEIALSGGILEQNPGWTGSDINY